MICHIPVKTEVSLGEDRGVAIIKTRYELDEEEKSMLTTRLTYCISTARAWVNAVALSPFADLDPTLTKYFLSGDRSISEREKVCERVMSVVNETRKGINKEQRLKVRDLRDTVSGKKSGGFWGDSRQRISLNFKKIRTQDRDNDFWARVFLHEATHLYAKTDDVGGYIDMKNFRHSETPYGAKSKITTETALTNADSFSHFIYEAAIKRDEGMLAALLRPNVPLAV